MVPTIMAEMNCEVAHCPKLGTIHWMLDPWLAGVVNQSERFHLGALRILFRQTSIVCAGPVKMEVL